MPPEGSDFIVENHFEVASYIDIPYTHIEPLGQGGYATVDKVRDGSGALFARKTLRRRYHEDPESVKIQFLNEIAIARTLQDSPHIIKILASYSWGDNLALIIEPVADNGSLESFLVNPDWAVLRTAFGCLTKGLAYIHQKLIRHKDISPANILVHQGKVLFSDFGISLDCSLSQTTTTGIAGPANRRYSAPEVVLDGKRTRKSDVFSLGAVFCEIISRLDNTQERSLYYSDRIEQLITELQTHNDALPPIIYQATSMMIQRDIPQRPSADEVCAILNDPSLYCEECQTSPADYARESTPGSDLTLPTIVSDSNHLLDKSPILFDRADFLRFTAIQSQTSAPFLDDSSSISQTVKVRTPRRSLVGKSSVVPESDWTQVNAMLNQVLNQQIESLNYEAAYRLCYRIDLKRQGLRLFHMTVGKLEEKAASIAETLALMLSCPQVCDWLVLAWGEYKKAVLLMTQCLMHTERLLRYPSSIDFSPPDLMTVKQLNFVGFEVTGACIFRDSVLRSETGPSLHTLRQSSDFDAEYQKCGGKCEGMVEEVQRIASRQK